MIVIKVLLGGSGSLKNGYPPVLVLVLEFLFPYIWRGLDRLWAWNVSDLFSCISSSYQELFPNGF